MRDTDEFKVGDVMTRGVICIDSEDTVLRAAEIMDKNDISSVIVTKKGNGVGIVTERDITGKVVAKSKDPKRITVSEIMTSPLVTIGSEADIDDAARLMRDKNIHRLVISDKEKIIGILSEFDLVRVEPALHLLIREHTKWDIAKAHAAGEGAISGICESCENYSEKLRSVDGRLLCDDCLR